MSVSGFEDSIEVASSQTATNTSTSLAASTASYAGSSQHHQPQPSAGLQQAHLAHAHAGAAGHIQPLNQPQQNQERHPSLLHNVSSASGASAQPGYHSSQNQNQALLQHNTSSSSHSSKRANR